MSDSIWTNAGDFLSDNGSSLLGLAGAVVTGNVPAGIAAVSSMMTEATNEQDPKLALASLKANPDKMIRLEEIIKRDEADIRMHHRIALTATLEDRQKEHSETQKTIREGDAASDEYVRHTRPKMARESWAATAIYISLMEIIQAFSFGSGAEIELAAMLLAPAGAYMGFRSADKAFNLKDRLANTKSGAVIPKSWYN